MKKILIIGIGAGHPDYLTIQAVDALNRADVFFMLDKGAEKETLIEFRREICRRFIKDRDYRFIDAAEFARLQAAGELLEWAEVHGNQYATPKATVLAALNAGNDVLFDIDWQGARQIRDRMGEDVVSVFILPPEGQALERRLRGRAQDSEEEVERRLAAAAAEIGHWDEYDYVLINADLERSFAGLSAILAAERLKRVRQPGLADFVWGVLSGL